jgi:hypothetical protein
MLARVRPGWFLHHALTVARITGTEVPVNSRSLLRYALSVTARSGIPAARSAASIAAASAAASTVRLIMERDSSMPDRRSPPGPGLQTAPDGSGPARCANRAGPAPKQEGIGIAANITARTGAE